MQLAIEAHPHRLAGYGAYSTHFDAIGEDGRFSRLPLAAASSLMAKGYGYGAEGDALAATMVSAGHQLSATRTSPRCTRWTSRQRLDPHEPHGRGQLAVARTDEPVRLIKRSLGIGKLEDPPTFLFRIQPGPATLASLVSLGGERFRMVVSEGEVLD